MTRTLALDAAAPIYRRRSPVGRRRNPTTRAAVTTGSLTARIAELLHQGEQVHVHLDDAIDPDGRRWQVVDADPVAQRLTVRHDGGEPTVVPAAYVSRD